MAPPPAASATATGRPTLERERLTPWVTQFPLLCMSSLGGLLYFFLRDRSLGPAEGATVAVFGAAFFLVVLPVALAVLRRGRWLAPAYALFWTLFHFWVTVPLTPFDSSIAHFNQIRPGMTTAETIAHLNRHPVWREVLREHPISQTEEGGIYLPAGRTAVSVEGVSIGFHHGRVASTYICWDH